MTRLTGPKHQRTSEIPGYIRWCHQRGSIYLADQKFPITYQRVRDLPRNQAIPLPTYQQLQTPRAADAWLFRNLLLGLSCRDDEVCAEAAPETFGLSPSSAPAVSFKPERGSFRPSRNGDWIGITWWP